jgi:glycosyltransferase involved in cell wall biosynthesis
MKTKKFQKSYAPKQQIKAGPILTTRRKTDNVKVLAVGGSCVSDSIRIISPGRRVPEEVSNVSINYTLPKNVSGLDFLDYDIIYLSRPTPETIPILTLANKRGISTIVDWDDDFTSIPSHHPGYYGIGPGNPRIAQAVTESIKQATVLSVASRVLQERFGSIREQTYGMNDAVFVQNTWDNQNLFWNRRRERERKPDTPFTIGWCGTITHRKDFAMILPGICQFLGYRPEARIIIGGDEQIYDSLDGKVSERQKIYIPMVSYRCYPLMVSLFDILLAPLVDDEFNRAKSNIKLVDASAIGIPWIASPLPQYVDWPSGGIISEDQNWERSLVALYEQSEYYKELSRASDKQAKNCETDTVVDRWVEMIEMCGYDLQKKDDKQTGGE